MELNQERIEQGIINEAVDHLINEEYLAGLVTKEVKARIDAIFAATATDQVSKAVNQAIEDGLNREYSKVNSWGEKVGGPTTISKELERVVSGYWNQRVDAKGKPTDNSYSSITRAEWMMTELAAKDFEGEMKQHIINVGGALKDALRDTMHENVNKMISEVFHVKSLNDVKLKSTGRACIDPPATPKD